MTSESRGPGITGPGVRCPRAMVSVPRSRDQGSGDLESRNKGARIRGFGSKSAEVRVQGQEPGGVRGFGYLGFRAQGSGGSGSGV